MAVTITKPMSGAQLKGTVTVEATFSGKNFDIATCTIDGQQLASDAAVPISLAIDTTKVADGARTLTVAVRYRTAGGKLRWQKATIQVMVANVIAPEPTPPPGGAIIFQDDFEVDYPATHGVNTNAAPYSNGNPPGAPACYGFTASKTWQLNLGGTPGVDSGIFSNVVPPAPGKGNRCLRFDLPAGAAGRQAAFIHRGVNRIIGERYYGLMLYLPASWREPAGAPDDTNVLNDTWGSVLATFNYPPFIHGGSSAGLSVHVDSIKMSVQAGEGVFPNTYPGSPGPTHWNNGGNYQFSTGNMGPADSWRPVPLGGLTKQAWHEIIVGINWTLGPEEGGSNAFWKAWWRIKGQGSWTQTVDVTGAYASHWWGRDQAGCVFAPSQIPGLATYNPVGAYRAGSNYPLHYFIDNYVEGSTFAAVAATMP